MKKIRNVLIIALLFASIFGVINFDSFVKAETGTNLVINSTFDANINNWHTDSKWTYDATNHRAKGPSGVVAYLRPNTETWSFNLDHSKTYTFYYDGYFNPSYNSGLYFYFNGDTVFGITIYNSSGTNNWNAGANSFTVYYSNLSIFDGMTMEEIYNWALSQNNAPARNPYSDMDFAKFAFIGANATEWVDNVYLWEGASKASVDGTLEAYCGDGTCNGTEDCATCELDCGSCYSGTVTNTLTPSAALTGEAVSGTVILTDGLSRQKPDSVTLTVNGASLVTTSGPITNDENFTHYEFVPASNSLSQGDHVITAVANYNGTDYTGTAMLTVSPPGEGTPPINLGDEGSVTVDGIKFTFNFTKENYELNEEGKFLYVNVEKLSGFSAPEYKYYVTITTPDGQSGGGFTNYEAFSPNSVNVRVGANSGTMNGTVKILYRTMIGLGDWKEVTLTDSATVGTVSNSPGTIAEQNKTLAQKIAEAPKKALEALATGATKVLTAGYNAIKTVASDGYDAGKTVASDVADAVSDPAKTVWKAVTDTGKAVYTAVTGGSTSGGSIFSGLSGFLSKAVYGIPVIFIVIGVVLIIVLRRN